MATFEERRAQFGERLRSFREQAGLTGRDFAAALGGGWTQSRISKLETGKQTATDSDVTDLLAALGAEESAIEDLLDELRELRVEEVAWRRQLRGGHRARQAQIGGLEHEATVIRGVATAAVPGLLQTANYARAMFATQSELHEIPRDLDEAVRERLRRQQVLYEPDKQIEILVSQGALLHPIASPPDMAAQIDRLSLALGLPNVRFGVLPASHQLPHVPLHGYWIFDDQVLVENITAELRITDPDQIVVYHRLTDRLWNAAVEGDEARALLHQTAERYTRDER